MGKYPTVNEAVEKLVDDAYTASSRRVALRVEQEIEHLTTNVGQLLFPNSHRIEEQVGQDLGMPYDEAIL